MRKVLSVLAGGALAIMLSAPAAHAAPAQSHAQQLRGHHGLVGQLVEDLLDWLEH